MEPKNIADAIRIVPETDIATLDILNAAYASASQFAESSDFKEGHHDKPVGEIYDEDFVEQLYTIAPTYPFVTEFTFFEFKAFFKIHKKCQEEASGIKRKRGRPKRTEEDECQQRVSDCEIIERKFPQLRHNVLTNEFQYQRINPDTRKFYWYSAQGDDLNQLSIVLAVEHGENIPLKRAQEAFVYVARHNPYEPQIDMLEHCSKQYPDMDVDSAKEFLNTIGTKLLGTHPEEPLIEGQTIRDRFLARFFIGMAYLARHPKETLQWMPILIGAQGCGKSQLCTHMIPDKFKDLFQQVTHPIEVLKREPYQLHSGFLIEMPEIDANMRGLKSIEPMKNLISTRVDICRRPYAAMPEKMPRRFALIGTTNRSDLFQDGTGERRYLPLKIPYGFELPWREMQQGLNEKIWAAANVIALTMTGEEIELKGFTKEEQAIIADAQTEFTQVDPWATKLDEFIRVNQQYIFTTTDVLTHIGVEASNQTQAHSRRVNNLIQQIYKQSAQQRQKRIGKKTMRVWVIEDLGTEELETQEFDEYVKTSVSKDF